jgi:aminoglycoside/choline kinase family phosphotransferase
MREKTAMSERVAALKAWLRDQLGMKDFTFAPASSDASFRRYYRVGVSDGSHIVMDAPPDKEDVGPFIAIARAMAAVGLNVPRILAEDRAQGFLLLSDLGSRHYLQELTPGSVEHLYGDALAALRRLQSAPVPAGLPDYDRALLLREMGLFRDWYLLRHLGWTPDPSLDEVLAEGFDFLAGEALAQPRVWVHRDYHSRNLMVCVDHNPGILDFQDAVAGPVTYDLVSLLRDCYIAWPRERVACWAEGYWAALRAEGRLQGVTAERFLRWFDLMGVQRHLKAIGIFARLNLRDGKPGYLADIPRTLAYVLEVSGRYPELRDLRRLLETRGLAQPR